MCIKQFPELGNYFRCLSSSGNLGTLSEASLHKCSSPSRKNDAGSVYMSLLKSLLEPPIQRTCIAEPLHASSTDNLPTESIAQTLFPKPQYTDEHSYSYWSSKGESNVDVPEMLTYRLVSDICVVHSIKIQPFLAFFQSGHPIYSAKMVRFRFGYPRIKKRHWSGLFQSLVAHRSQKASMDDYVWTYVSPEFPMRQENILQTFELPRPTVCIGGILQVEFMGREQTQSSDNLYYICISHVYVSGRPILGFKLENMLTNQKVLLRQLTEEDKGSLSNQQSLDPFIEMINGVVQGIHDPLVDNLLWYLYSAGLLHDLREDEVESE
ncbi:hypothetical protein KP509_20G052200 [Ceratopteris richardii]|nr:hypothetical protein KP509_20G052200 [Ceratopteris richardii]